MAGCCGDRNVPGKEAAACSGMPPQTVGCCAAAKSPSDGPLGWFDNMIPNCLAYATQMKQQGHPIVGILCEYTPRELIMAAGAVPVCLCGGSVKTIVAAEEHLPSNLCPLIKSTYGYHLMRSNPFLEMADLIVAETTCDGKKKMYELMGETRPMQVLELPQKTDDPDAFAHWYRELQKFRAFLEHRFGVQITDEKLLESIKAMNRERSLRRKLADLMQAEITPMTGRQLLELKSIISAFPAVLEQYEKALSQLEKTQGPKELASKVRVLMTGVPLPHGAERVLDIIESHGGVVVAMENCSGLKPIMENVLESGDPLRAIAEKYFHLPCSVMTHNRPRLELLKELTERYRPQCVIELVWQACLTYDVEAYQVKRYTEQELKLPYLRIETDYSPSDSARIATRVEAMFETARQR